MTTGLRIPSTYYMDLINAFPPRPINNDIELVATQNRINSILDKTRITDDDRDYLKVLGMLVYEYEEKHEPQPTIKGVELLKALIEESHLQPQNLVSIFKNEEAVLEILAGKSQLTESQRHELATLFHVSPDAFISGNFKQG